MKKLLIMFICILFPSVSFAANQTYQDIMKGKSCDESSSQQIDCKYKVGRDLNIYIAGIGLPDNPTLGECSDVDQQGEVHRLWQLCACLPYGCDLHWGG